jgi:hypothetical protein
MNIKKKFILICSFILLCGCGTDPKTTYEKNLEYEHITIEGMPCLVFQSATYSGYNVNSITCDWSKWSGK